MTTTQSLIPAGYSEARKFGTGPDFSVYTGAMKPISPSSPIEVQPEDRDKPILAMCGSSTVEDLQGDDMSSSALQSMTTIPENLTFWLNHQYNLPYDAAGKLYSQPKIIMWSGIADFWLASEIFLRNPAAEKTYDLITKDGARFGCSIGCQVLKWDFANPDDPYSSGIHIQEVRTLEFSLCGIPANQRCWVENAIKGLFARSLIEGDGDKALSLAPAYKGLFTRSYDEVTRNVTSAGLRRELERMPMRYTASQKIIYDFTEGREGFTLRDSKGVTIKSLTREEVAGLLEQKHTDQQQVTQPTESKDWILPLVSDAQTNDVTSEDLDAKSVSGNTSFPLMDIGTEWDGSKAESQIFAYAKGDDGEISVSKAKQGFLYYDPDNSDTQKGYKMPFVYIVSGSPKIVPLGVRTIAGILNGSMGGISASIEDKNGMKTKVKTLYGRINSQFHPDPEWIVPWEKKDSYHLSVEDVDEATYYEICEELSRRNVH